MLNLSLAVCEAITPRKNSQNLMTLLCVTQLQATMGVHKKYIKLKGKIHQMNISKYIYSIKLYSMLPSIRTVAVSGHLKQKLNFRGALFSSR